MSSKKISGSLHLADLMMDIMPKAMQSIREEMRQGRGDRLTVPQFRVLANVNRGLNHNKIIGERLGVSEAAISRMIDLLVKDGLIKKSVSKTDRRQSSLALTSEGAALFNYIKSDARGRLKLKLAKIPSNDLAMIVSGLEVLKNHISLLD